MTARRYAHTRPAPEPIRRHHWSDDAACLDMDVELFNPTALGHSGHQGRAGGGNPLQKAWNDEALAICAACPVRAQCLEANLEDRWLIVGGTTPDQRARLRRKRAKETTA